MSGLLQTFQSAAGMQGDESAAIGDLFAIFLAVTAFFYLLVTLFLLWAILRRRRDPERRERPLKLILAGWVGVIAATLAALTIATWLYDRNLAYASEAPALEIEVTANQWWWDVRYMDAEPSRIVHTANELHLPVGVPVRLTLRSNDVIHSFWIPNLAGKQDMIPGRQNQLSLTPLVEGLFRAQCAEFCGIQHANMALDVTVESPAAFAAWRAAQLTPAPEPATPLTRLGFAIVTTGPCASCHNIAGARASGQVAPDLTHFAGRRSIAAGRLAMSHDNIARWIADPQGVKPGNNMPQVRMTDQQLRAVTAYLETLR